MTGCGEKESSLLKSVNKHFEGIEQDDLNSIMVMTENT